MLGCTPYAATGVHPGWHADTEQPCTNLKQAANSPQRSEPLKCEYILVPKKVALDSLVEFSPQELNSCP
jgi:hypothetical protein